MRRFIRAAASGGAIAAFAALLPLAAGAHENYGVPGGQYAMEIGFIDEPAYVDQKNGLYLNVTRPEAPGATPVAAAEAGDGHGGTGVAGLAGSLQAEVRFGEETMALPLTPAFDEPGVYESVFFPTAVGDYTFRIFGDIEGTAVDQAFTSSPEGFDSVREIEPLRFPKGDGEAEDGIVVGSVGLPAAGTGRGTGGGLLLGAVGLVGAGLVLGRRRGRLLVPVAARA